MKTKKIAILGMFLESNRHSPIVTREKFRVFEGEAITLDVRSDSPDLVKEVIGFFHGMDFNGNWEPIPLLIAHRGAGGPADAVFIRETIEKICHGLTNVLPLDGVYILNHGAMITTEDEDPDGELYEAVRNIVGSKTPVVTTIDLHANISQRMVDNADVIVSYRTDPHVDQYDCGREAAAILGEMLEGIRPVVRNIRLPIVPPNVSLLTDSGPYGDLIKYGQSQLGSEILNVSVVAGFAYSDTSKNGLHVIVAARENSEAAERLCFDIAQKAWADRERFMWNLTSIEKAVEMALVAGEDLSGKPLLLADLGDNIGAGGTGNTLWMLEALYRSGAKGVLIGSFCDPNLATRAHEAGIGASFKALFQGDDWDRPDPHFAVDRVRVKSLHPGKFRISRGPLTGIPVDAGPICLLQLGDMMVLVTTSRPIVWPDPILLETMGLEIREIRTLVLKCRSNYRAVFDKYFDQEMMIEVDTPGRTSPVLTRHSWKFLPRPVFPIDRDFEWSVPKF
ncbi:MAG: M81 family metallopeptidase [SAR324 cluster bacterium]|nr:M81 family metallopeptidase [SAR324 cluster bacterium]